MPWFKTAHGLVHVRMSKPRVKSCRIPLDGKLCRAKPAEWLCDSCDVAMCADCKVTTSRNGVERDFCAVCIEPVFRNWVKATGLYIPVGTKPAPTSARTARRNAFRAWAKRNPEFFASVPLSKAGAA